MKLETINVSGTTAVVTLDPPMGVRTIPVAAMAPRPKPVLDYSAALVGLALTAVIAAILLVLNPIFNPGPVFFRQRRMGLGGRRFEMWKFRTMLPAGQGGHRAHDAPLEMERVTPLGRLLRRTRLDELPNFINVWRGEMSLIGPRPDVWEHSLIYANSVPHYAERFRVRPGITGLAQVRGGYADTHRAVERKARFDRFYVERGSVWLDLYIALRTVRVMATGFGAK